MRGCGVRAVRWCTEGGQAAYIDEENIKHAKHVFNRLDRVDSDERVPKDRHAGRCTKYASRQELGGRCVAQG